MYQILCSLLGEEQGMLITLMVSSIPISYILSLFRNKYLILTVSILFSAIFQSLMFPVQKYFLWVQQQLVFILLKLCPRKIIGKIILVQSFIFLSLVQLRRMYLFYGVNGVDVTGILMMQTFLYIGLAYNYQNGQKKDEELSEGARKRKVQQLPSYFEYLGYVFFLPSCLVGPVFEFRDFQDYINRKGDYAQLPNTLKPAFKQLLILLMSLGIYFSTKHFDLWYTVSDEFATHSYFYKIGYIMITITNIQFKYITAWSLGMIWFTLFQIFSIL